MHRGPSRAAAAPGVFLGFGALIFAVFGLAFWAPFIYDDVIYILEYPEVFGPWRGWAHWISTSLYNHGEYEPLGTLVNRGIYLAAGDSRWAFRLSSLLLHWACVAAFFAVARRLLPLRPAVAAAAVFSVFPAHVELMAIAAFKKHLLITLCGLGMLRLSLAGSRRFLADAAAAALFGAALLAKESALMLPMLLALFKTAVPQARRPRRGELALFGAFAAIAAAYVMFRATVAPRQVPPLLGSLAAHLLTSGKCLLWYLGQLALPVSLCQEHSMATVTRALSLESAAVAAGLLCAGAAAAALWRRDRLLGLAAGWCAITLLPFLNIFPFLNLSLVANRYLYLASAGWALGLGRLLVLAGLHSTRASFLAAAALILPYAWLATRQLARYSDQLEFWTQTAACAPGHPRAHMALGANLRARGRFEEAAAEFRRVEGLGSLASASLARIYLARVYLDTGRLEDAITLARANADAEPAAAHAVAGVALMRLGRFERALPELEAALLWAPHQGDLMISLGQCLNELDRRPDAERLWRLALAPPASRAAAAALLGGLLEDDRPLEARALYELSLERNPLQVGTAAALARLLARSGEPAAALRLMDSLVAAHERAVEGNRASNGDVAAWTLTLTASRQARERLRNELARSAARRGPRAPEPRRREMPRGARGLP